MAVNQQINRFFILATTALIISVNFSIKNFLLARKKNCFIFSVPVLPFNQQGIAGFNFNL
jgi:hypothetical protein